MKVLNKLLRLRKPIIAKIVETVETAFKLEQYGNDTELSKEYWTI